MTLTFKSIANEAPNAPEHHPYDWRVERWQFVYGEYLICGQNLCFPEGHMDRNFFWRVGAANMCAGRYDWSRAVQGIA